MARVGRVLDGASDGLRLEQGEILAGPEVEESLQLSADLHRLQPWPCFTINEEETSIAESTGVALWWPRGVVAYDFHVRVQLGVAGTDRFFWGIDTSKVAILNALVGGASVKQLDVPAVLKTADGTDSGVEAQTFENTAANLALVASVPSYQAKTRWEHQTDQHLEWHFPVIGNGTGFLGWNQTVTNSLRVWARWTERPRRS